MQEHAVVAAVVAGDADGFAAVYDQYATSLYACCHAVLPEPEAAGAVLDTFLIATVKLDGLRDPDRLGAWLHAVARNECLRRLGPGQEIPPEIPAAIPAAIRAAADHGGEPPEVPLPPDLRSQVLTACADNSPSGRAHRMSVAHRAGVFGPAGFPKAMGSSGPWWWRVRRHRGVVAAAAAVAALAVAAGITAALTAGGSHRLQASSLVLGGDAPTPASSTSPGAISPTPSPARTTPASTRPTSPAALVGVTSAGSSAEPGTAVPGASPSGASASPSPSPSSSPAQGHLLVAPGKLTLTSKSGTPASGSFGLTAVNGPVSDYTVRVAAGPARVTVTPTGGSLLADGHVEVIVTVTSKAGLTAHIVVQPGNLAVTVVYKVMPQPAPKPPPKA
jgi:DNA-directed RNA polymerase specialized sigma24 family protein